MSKARPVGAYKNLRPIMVEWVDSMASSGWGDPRTPADMRCVSVGHLVRRTKDRVHIALNRSANSHGDHIEIPLCAVTRVRRLK